MHPKNVRSQGPDPNFFIKIFCGQGQSTKCEREQSRWTKLAGHYSMRMNPRTKRKKTSAWILKLIKQAIYTALTNKNAEKRERERVTSRIILDTTGRATDRTGTTPANTRSYRRFRFERRRRRRLRAGVLLCTIPITNTTITRHNCVT